MSWKHIVVEGYCLFNTDEELNIPSCCKYEPGNIGMHCLDSDDDDYKRCPFFAYGKARSTIILTDSKGEEAAYNAFWSEEDKGNNEEWAKNENKWMEDWKGKILE